MRDFHEWQSWRAFKGVLRSARLLYALERYRREKEMSDARSKKKSEELQPFAVLKIAEADVPEILFPAGWSIHHACSFPRQRIFGLHDDGSCGTPRTVTLSTEDTYVTQATSRFIYVTKAQPEIGFNNLFKRGTCYTWPSPYTNFRMPSSYEARRTRPIPVSMPRSYALGYAEVHADEMVDALAKAEALARAGLLPYERAAVNVKVDAGGKGSGATVTPGVHRTLPSSEKKVRVPAWLLRTIAGYHAATEVKDAVECLFKALPGSVQGSHLRGSNVEWGHKGTTGFAKAAIVLGNLDKIDPIKAASCLAANEVEDRIIGGLHGVLNKTSGGAYGGPSGTAMTSYLRSLTAPVVPNKPFVRGGNMKDTRYGLHKAA